MFYLFTQKPARAGIATLMAIMLSVSLYAVDHSQGCLISQDNDVKQVLMEAGTVGQTFAPCETGTLEYITLSVESTDDMTFTALLTIKHQGESIASQQFVVPAHGQGNKVKAWIAQPPSIEAGELYDIELEVPGDHSFYVYYSPVNTYESGRMTINGLQTMGDLAFEAGIRLKNQRPMFQIQHRSLAGCEPVQGNAELYLQAGQLVSQSVSLCERSEISGVTFQYRSGSAVNGLVEIYKSGAIENGPLAVWPFDAETAQGMTPLYVAATEVLVVDPGIQIEFHIVSEDGEPLPNNLQFYYGQNDPYAHGQMITDSNESGLDLTFALEVIVEEVEDDNDNDEFNVFVAHPDHECTVAQPYWNYTHTFSGATEIEIELPLCDDGKLEAVYLPGVISQGGEVNFTLKSDRGKILRTGQLTPSSQFNGTLVAELDDAPVLFYFGYSLILEVTDGTVFQMNASTSSAHGGLTNLVDGQNSQTELCYVSAMRPYTYDFDAAEEERNDVTLNVYPNPFLSQFTVNIDGLEGRNAVVTLYNFQGIEVYSSMVESQRGASTTLEVIPEGLLTRGYYTLRVEFEDQVVLETVMKQ